MPPPLSGPSPCRVGANSCMRRETAPLGLGTKSTAPRRKASKRRLGACFSHRRDHDDGAGPLHHDPIQALQPVHLRHLHIQGNDVRLGTSRVGPAPPVRCARPRTSKSGSSARTRLKSLRTSAESSTTRTLITHPSAVAVPGTCPAMPCSARVSSSIGSSSSTMRLEEGEIDDAAHQPGCLVRELRRRLDRAQSSSAGHPKRCRR